jgi:hypothetical protein
VAGERAVRLKADPEVRIWLAAHPSAEPRVIAYDIHRCCGGGKICQIKFRVGSKRDNLDGYVPGTLDDGTTFLIDPRAAGRLPSTVGLKVRGLGRMKHLDLDLDAEQWGTLLYD